MESLNVNYQVELRKTHPCGSDVWRVYRVGMDIGLQCTGCGRRILLPRAKFKKQVKRIIPSDQR